MMKLIVSALFPFFLFESVLAAQATTSAKKAAAERYNLSIEGEIGYPFVSLTNPDSSKAYYDGVALRLNVLVPIFDSASAALYLVPAFKYLDLSNTAQTGTQSEVANIIGPGAGLAFRLSKFRLGAQIYQLWGRHYSTGTFSDRLNYSFRSVDYSAGIFHQFGRLSVGASYSISKSTIPIEPTGLNTSTPYEESVIAFQLTYNTGDSLWQIIRSLF